MFSHYEKVVYMLRIIIVSLLFVTLSSCGGDDSQNNLLEHVNSNRTKWEGSGIDTYSYNYSFIPSDCPAVDLFPPVVISVESGSVVSVYNTVFGSFESNLENWPTIDQIFENLLVLASQDQLHFSKSLSELDIYPEFDSEYGYPASFYVDESDAECDAQSVTVSEFQ